MTIKAFIVDTKGLLHLRHPSFSDVVYFVNDPIETFFNKLLYGVDGTYRWTTCVDTLNRHLEEVLYYFVDELETLNLIDEGINFHGHVENYTSTYGFLEYFIYAIGNHLHSLLATPNKSVRIHQYVVRNKQVIVTHFTIEPSITN